MQRLYLKMKIDPAMSYADVIPVWRNFCEHLHDQMKIHHEGLPDRAYQTEWRKLRDSHLTQWQAQLSGTGTRAIKAAYLEFPDAEHLLAFELAWS